MTAYFVLKYVHVIGAAVLLSTGAGIAFFMLLAHLRGEPALIAGIARIVVIADFIFTATAVIAQPITGVLLARRRGQNLLTQESHFDSRLQIRGGSLEPRRSERGRVAYPEGFVAG